MPAPTRRRATGLTTCHRSSSARPRPPGLSATKLGGGSRAWTDHSGQRDGAGHPSDSAKPFGDRSRGRPSGEPTVAWHRVSRRTRHSCARRSRHRGGRGARRAPHTSPKPPKTSSVRSASNTTATDTDCHLLVLACGTKNAAANRCPSRPSALAERLAGRQPNLSENAKRRGGQDRPKAAAYASVTDLRLRSPAGR